VEDVGVLDVKHAVADAGFAVHLLHPAAAALAVATVDPGTVGGEHGIRGQRAVPK